VKHVSKIGDDSVEKAAIEKESVVVKTPVKATDAPDKQKDKTVESGIPGTWKKSYGESHDDEIFDILLTDDGRMYLLGGTNIEWEPERHADMYLILIDSTGEVLWEKTYETDTWGMSLADTSDGNVLIAGIKLGGDTGIDPYLMKIDPKGNELWSKTIPGPMDEWVNTVELTSDGGYILVGNRVNPNDFITDPSVAGYGGFDGRSNPLLIKIDAEGKEEWNHVYESENNIMTTKGLQTPDGGYAVFGTILYFPEPGDDQILMKVDESGEEEWTHTWEEGRTNARDFILTSDGNLVLISLFSASGDPRRGDADLMVSKVNLDGENIWETMYGESDIIELGSAITETSKGSYIIAGDRTRDLYGSHTEMLLIKVDPNGQVEWAEVVMDSPHFMIQGLLEHQKEGYIIAATDYSRGDAEILVIKTDAKGRVSK
jgi:hypothetical protein